MQQYTISLSIPIICARKLCEQIIDCEVRGRINHKERLLLEKLFIAAYHKNCNPKGFRGRAFAAYVRSYQPILFGRILLESWSLGDRKEMQKTQ